MNTDYLNEIADAGGAVATHIMLIDNSDTKIDTLKAANWTAASNGTIRPGSDLTFSVPAGTTVKGWRAYDSEEVTNYGGADFATPESFENDGEFTIIAASTGIVHSAT